MLGCKAKWARLARAFACQRYREKGLCRDGGISFVLGKLAPPWAFAEEVSFPDSVVEFTFRLGLERPLSKSTQSFGAIAWPRGVAFRSDRKARCAAEKRGTRAGQSETRRTKNLKRDAGQNQANLLRATGVGMDDELNEVTARAVNAEPWEPLAGMMKRQCSIISSQPQRPRRWRSALTAPVRAVLHHPR